MSINVTFELFFVQRIVGISLDLEIHIPHIGVETNESKSISPIPFLHIEQIMTFVS